MKKVMKVQSTDVCGACQFCHTDPSKKDNYLCWGKPPSAVGDSSELLWVRSAPVGVADPKCHIYVPRRNS